MPHASLFRVIGRKDLGVDIVRFVQCEANGVFGFS
jgi:hypothetical protein